MHSLNKLNSYFDLHTTSDKLTFYSPFVAGLILLSVNVLSFITL